MTHTKATQLFLNLFRAENPAKQERHAEKSPAVKETALNLPEAERECYDKCVAIATIEGSVSAFSLQSRLRIGFDLAERMMRLMSACGLIEPAERINHPYKLAR